MREIVRAVRDATLVPDVTADVEVAFNRDLFYRGFHDMTPLVEDGVDVVQDSDPNGEYLIGYAKHRADGLRSSLVVMKVNPATKLVDRYAVLNSRIDWTGAPSVPEPTAQTHFGAAFTYGTDVYFHSTSGWGIFKLINTGGIDVPPECWNLGLDTTLHIKCGTETTLKWVAPSDQTDPSVYHHGGLSCSDGSTFLA